MGGTSGPETSGLFLVAGPRFRTLRLWDRQSGYCQNREQGEYPCPNSMSRLQEKRMPTAESNSATHNSHSPASARRVLGQRSILARTPEMRIAKEFCMWLAIVLAVGNLSCGTCVPRPMVSTISPDSATAGGNQFVLTINGSDFRRDSSVSWNGSFRTTSFVSTHQLVATITATDIAQPGMLLVLVFNPPERSTTSVSGAIGMNSVTVCSGKNSNAVPFTIQP